MEMTDLPLDAQLSGNVLLYSKPEPVSLEMHGKLGLKRTDKPYAFAATTHFVPIQVTEFTPAALSYPIIFAGSDYQPLAVMGLTPGENLFINADGSFKPDAYIPAYIRRYPFVLANDEAGQRMILCIERTSDLLSEDNPDVKLFENGEASEYTKNCMQFCTDFDTERRRTEAFVAMLKELDLFETKKAVYAPRMPDGSQGPQELIAEYFAISEEKLKALSPEKLA